METFKPVTIGTLDTKTGKFTLANREAMTLERQAFEEWITAPPFERGIERYGEQSAWPGNYQDYDTQIAWNGWQAAIANVSRAAEPVVSDGLIESLRRQRQVDEDGTECGVSRQAVDEAITILESLTHPSEDARPLSISAITAATGERNATHHDLHHLRNTL